jgi:hypothetical protein
MEALLLLLLLHTFKDTTTTAYVGGHKRFRTACLLQRISFKTVR